MKAFIDISRIVIAAAALTSMAGCDALMDPSVSMGVDVGSGGVVPYGNINLSTVFSPYYYDGPYYWGSNYYPPSLPWRPPQTIVNNPPPRQPGGSFPGSSGLNPINPGVGPVIRPGQSIPVRPPLNNGPTGSGQRPGGNTPIQSGGGSGSVRPGGR